MVPARGIARPVEMMSLYHTVIAPFLSYSFMRRALVACAALSIGSGPIGVLLLLRRMSLIGDAMSHAVLPGAAAGFLIAGLSLWGMTAGGLVAGLVVAILAGVVSRRTALREDASFAGFYLTSLALGVMLVSMRGSNIDLLHILFGTILAVDNTALYLVGGIATISTLGLLAIYRPLVLESFDPGFLRAVGGHGSLYHQIFMILVVLNLVAGFQALGTLMAVGLMMLPAAAARLWAAEIWSMALVAMLIAFLSGAIGLLTSFRAGWPSGPAIILSASVFYLVSIVFGPCGGVLPARLRFTLWG
jgi:zinc/manganese transport system permease protein